MPPTSFDPQVSITPFWSQSADEHGDFVVCLTRLGAAEKYSRVLKGTLIRDRLFRKS